MALTFNCPNCGKEITSQFLRHGEQCLCRNCNQFCVVPPNAVENGKISSLVKQVRATKGHSAINYPQTLDTRLAGRGERLVAAIIDIIIYNVIFVLILVPTIAFVEEPSDEQALLLILTVIFVPMIINILIQGYFLTIRGQTIGKMTMSIKIVRYRNFENGGFIYNVLLREILNGILCIIPFYSLIDILLIFGADKRCLHDHIAGTLVVPADFVPPEHNPFTGQPVQLAK